MQQLHTTDYLHILISPFHFSYASIWLPQNLKNMKETSMHKKCHTVPNQRHLTVLILNFKRPLKQNIDSALTNKSGPLAYKLTSKLPNQVLNPPQENQSPSRASEPWPSLGASRTNLDTLEVTWGTAAATMARKKNNPLDQPLIGMFSGHRQPTPQSFESLKLTLEMKLNGQTAKK